MHWKSILIDFLLYHVKCGCPIQFSGFSLIILLLCAEANDKKMGLNFEILSSIIVIILLRAEVQQPWTLSWECIYLQPELSLAHSEGSDRQVLKAQELIAQTMWVM